MNHNRRIVVAITPITWGELFDFLGSIGALGGAVTGVTITDSGFGYNIRCISDYYPISPEEPITSWWEAKEDYQYLGWVPMEVCINDETNFLFFINLFKFLNFIKFNPINAAGNIPVSDKTE